MKVVLPDATADWPRLLEAQRRRRTLQGVVKVGALPHADAARRFWSQRVWSELAAVPAVSQVVLALTRQGAPLETLGAYTTIANDEVRHAQVAKQLADALGGYVDEVPADLPYDPRSLAAPSGVSTAVWALANGCFSETVSLELMRARHAQTTQPIVREVLAQTLKDEAVHVRIGWQLAAEVLPNVSRTERKELAGYGAELAQMLRCTFGTSGLPLRARRREEKVRDETAKASLGACSASRENAVVDAALEGIRRKLGPLGVSLR